MIIWSSKGSAPRHWDPNAFVRNECTDFVQDRSPNEIAIKYDRETGTPNTELELVLFLDGTGEGNVAKRSAEEFRVSWSRPKWHIVFEDE